MNKFKAGDRVKINVGLYEGFTGIVKNIVGGAFIVNIDEALGGDYLYLSENLELNEMPKFVEVKTKTVKKYAVVEAHSNLAVYALNKKYSESEVIFMNQEASKQDRVWTYHIVPTLFIEEEVPVKTETRYTFICKGGDYGYFGTSDKYKDLEEAKSRTMNQALQQIDSSAEEFEIE